MVPNTGEIVRRATPMWERELHARSLGDKRSTGRRLKRWQDVIGNRALLEKRLRNGNIDSVAALARLDDRADPISPPAWAETLGRLIHVLDQKQGADQHQSRDRAFVADEPLPFEEVFIPFLDVARARIGESGDASIDVLEPTASSVLERQLLSNLTFVAGLVMASEFLEFRFDAAPAAAFESAWAEQPRSSTIYSAFLSKMGRGGLIELLGRYPVLARLLCQLVDQWVASTRTLCKRLDQDFDRLVLTYGWPLERASKSVRTVRANLSDRHGNGQSVIELVVASGHRLIYKPRPVTAELSFQHIIRWFNRKTTGPGLRPIQVTPGDGYGWVEAIAPMPCRSEASVRRFYRRAGALLAALHVLAVTDIHRDNLIACGDDPVVVDLETMLYSTSQGVRPSVLHTGMLPLPQRSQAGGIVDMSALGADAAQDRRVPWIMWSSVNTDQMVMREDAPAGRVDHRVRVGRLFPTPKEHESDLLDGFEEAYLCFLHNRDELIRDPSIRDALDQVDLRVLVRDTTTYVQLQLHSLQPAYLSDGIDRSIELEWLARPLMSLKAPHSAASALYEAERTAMEALDVPYFAVGSVTFEGLADTRNMARVFGRRRDREVFVRRLRGLCPSDLSWQKSAIRNALEDRYGRTASFAM